MSVPPRAGLSAPSLGDHPARLARLGLYLVVGTLVYNVAEAVVALWAGIEAESIALLGFGGDSCLECLAALTVLWRLWGAYRGHDACAQERAEKRVHRVVGVTFLGLAAYVVAESLHALAVQALPGASVVGIVLAALSLAVMPGLALAKKRVARSLASKALHAEAQETLACAFLSATLLLGLSAHAVLGWWWLDSVAALLMVPWLLKEGVDALRGRGACGCAAMPLPLSPGTTP